MASFRETLARWINPSARIEDSSELLRLVQSGGMSTAGKPVTAQTALQQATVYACCRILGESIAQLPFQVFRRDGRRVDPATDHPLYPLLHDAFNGFETSFESRESMVGDLNLRGNTFYYKNISRSRRRIEELVPLHPDGMTVKRGEDMRPSFEYRDGAGKPKTYTSDQVWHVRGMSRDRLTGLSPIQVQRDTIGLALTQTDYGSRMLRNGAKMGGILRTPPFADDEKRERFRQQFDDAASGESANRTIILENTEGEYTRIAMTAEDAQFLESMRLSRSQIASIFRVPPHMVADLDKATFSNIEQQSLEFVTYSLLPWCKRIEQSANMHLLSERDRVDHFVKFNLSGLLRGDTKARADFYSKLYPLGVFNPNDILMLEDMNPREDAAGDEYRVTANTLPSDDDTDEATSA